MAESTLPQTTEDGLVYDFATPSDEDEVVDLVANDFCLTEPLNRSQKIPPEVAAPIMRILVRLALGQGLSLKATHGVSGQLVAVRLTFLHEKDAGEEERRREEEAEREVRRILPDRLRPFATFLTEVVTKNIPNIYERYGVGKYAEFFFVNVHKQYT
jgi:hypothetical protein